MRGYASCNHLDKPMPTEFDVCLFGQTITKHHSSKRELRSLQERDRLMESVSSSMDWKAYRRDNVELHLCESMPNRHPKTKVFGAREWVDVDRSHVMNEKRKHHKECPPAWSRMKQH